MSKALCSGKDRSADGKVIWRKSKETKADAVGRQSSVVGHQLTLARVSLVSAGIGSKCGPACSGS